MVMNYSSHDFAYVKLRGVDILFLPVGRFLDCFQEIMNFKGLCKEIQNEDYVKIFKILSVKENRGLG